MTTFATALSVFAAILGIAGAAAFVWAYYMVSLNKEQVAALRGDRDDLITRVKLLEEDREQRILLAAQTKVEKNELEAKIAVLEGIVTHDATINELIKAVERHDNNVERKYAEYITIATNTQQTVSRLLDRLEAQNAGKQ